MSASAGPPLVVRPERLEDFESFLECLGAVARERRYLALLEAPSREEAQAFLADARARGMVKLVAAQGERIVGWCDVIPKPFEGFRHSGQLGMGILANHRRRGLGTRLLAGTLEAAQRRGLTRIELQVFASNHAAIALYLRAGFQREGVKRAARLLDGVADDVICMARFLP